MATSGVKLELTENDKEFAIRYVEESGFYKTRLADFLELSRPTLDKILEENPGFFTQLKRSDAIFCKSLIETVKKKSPTFILKAKYKEEFNTTITIGFDPEIEIQRIKKIIDEGTTKEIEH